MIRDRQSDGLITTAEGAMPGSEIPHVPHNRLTYDEREVAAVADVVRSGHWSSGIWVQRLEAELCRRAEVAHAVAVDSGLSALRLTLLACGVQRNDRVLVPAYSCVALANAAAACGARSIPVDVIPGRWVIDHDQVLHSVRTQRPSAIIAVNLFGVSANYHALAESGVPVIEDCAHAFGVRRAGRLLGSQSDAAILSFHATKLIGAGEGGAILTNSPRLAEFVRQWRDYADQPPDGSRMNNKMSEFEAAIACCQLQRLEQTIAARSRLARRYEQLFRSTTNPVTNPATPLMLPEQIPDRIWYRYALQLRSRTPAEVIKQLNRNGVVCAEPVCDWRSGDCRHGCPTADDAYRSLLSLPLYPTLTDDEQDHVVRQLLRAMERIPCDGRIADLLTARGTNSPQP